MAGTYCSPADCEPVKSPKQKCHTIGELMDQKILEARKQVEQLCIIKAKLEALNVLDHETDIYSEFIFG